MGLGLNKSILQLAAGNTFQTRQGVVTVEGHTQGLTVPAQGLLGDTWHWPFPQAGRGVRATASCPLYPHGIPVLISHQHLLPRSLQCRAPGPAPGGLVKVQSEAPIKAPSLVGVICFLLNLSIFFFPGNSSCP